MKKKRLLGILLSLALMMTMMPAMAFAEGNSTDSQQVAEETQGEKGVQEGASLEVKADDVSAMVGGKLPAPENLNWSGWGSVSWDAVSGATGYHYKLERAYPNEGQGWKLLNEGDTTQNTLDVESIVNSDLALIIADPDLNGSPVSYVVELYAYNDTPSQNSDIRLDGSNISYVNVHTSDSTKGSVSGSGYFVPGESVAVTATPNQNYVVSKYILKSAFTVEERETDQTSFSYRLSSMNWDKWTDIEVVFDQEPEKVEINLDMGSDHTDLAKKVYNSLPASMRVEGYDDGPVVPIRVSKTSASTIQRMLNDAVYHALVFGGSGRGSRFDNNQFFQVVGQKDISEYTTIEEVYAEMYDGSTKVSGNQTFHALWATKKATYGSFTVKNNLCGKKVEKVKIEEDEDEPGEIEPISGYSTKEVRTLIDDLTSDTDMYKQTNTPEVVADSNSQFAVAKNLAAIMYSETSSALWLSSTEVTIKDFFDSENWYTGTMMHGNRYAMGSVIEPKINYYVDDYDPSDSNTSEMVIKVNGADASGISSMGPYVMFTSEITSDHDWDNGTVTKKPTATAEGIRTYKCKNYDTCGGIKTEAIPRLTPAISTTARTSSRSMIVKWTWGKVKGAKKYKIANRKAGSNKWKIKKTKKTKKMRYVVKGQKLKGLYEYKVAAVTNTGDIWSNVSYRYFKGVKASAKPGKGSINVRWKKDKGATGYEVLIAKNRKMKNAKKFKVSSSENSYKVTGLKKGKTYYVRVRPMKDYNGVTYTGVLCKARKATIK